MKSTTKNTRTTAAQITVTEQAKKQAQQKTITNMEKLQSANLDWMIEQRQTEMLKAAVGEGSYILSGYWNWFNDQINTAEESVGLENTGASQKVLDNFDNDVRAWKRARDLFFIAAPVALVELREAVAAQIAKEFASVDSITAADVSANLRNVTIGRLLREAEYSPFDPDNE